MNQDSYMSMPRATGDKTLYLYGVFDGHGPLGREVLYKFSWDTMCEGCGNRKSRVRVTQSLLQQTM